jgi:hypothetical protein
MQMEGFTATVMVAYWHNPRARIKCVEQGLRTPVDPLPARSGKRET